MTGIEVVTTNHPSPPFLDCCGGVSSTPPVILEADAIIKPKILMVRGYDNGIFQSLRDLRASAGNVGAGFWDYVETGGRNGKGYLLTDSINGISGGHTHAAYIKIPTTVASVIASGDTCLLYTSDAADERSSV